METFDGVLNDIWGQHVRPDQVNEALAEARGGAVVEGPVGGGRQKSPHGLKQCALDLLAAGDGRQPQVELLWRQNDGHPVMNVGHRARGVLGE